MKDESTRVFQNESDEAAPENNNKARKIATAAGIAAGAMGVGAAAAIIIDPDPPTPPVDPNKDEPVHEPDTTPAQPETSVVERVVVKEVPASKTEPEPKSEHDDNAITYDVDHAEVQVIEVGQTGEGAYYATANIDGHSSVFVDTNADGTVDVLGIDVNNNGNLESNEIMDISDRNISMHTLASNALGPIPGPTPINNHTDDPTPPTPGPTPPTPGPEIINVSEIQVGPVEHDAEHGADVADLEYRGHYGVAIDTDLDGRANTVWIDSNDNLTVEDNEIITENASSLVLDSNRANGNINVADPYPNPMGTDDPIAANDGLPDYMNDGNVGEYIV